MKKKIFIVILSLFASYMLPAQQFINKAAVEYEVKTNVKKTMGNSSWAEMLKENMPTYKTAYFHLSFADNKSVYKFHHWADGPKMPEFMRRNDEENVWYYDYNNGTFANQKSVFGSVFNIADSIKNIDWKLENENRTIAGFNCRKAVGKIMDSVYIFAFYTDEITLSGGPASANGLPGLILGLTIPRMYTSFIATKVIINDVDLSQIKPVAAKKPLSYTGLKTTFLERSKEWTANENDDDPESKKWLEQLLWSTFL
ncbi:MAG: GLPGLI family protein [Ferruginibacter sp.]